MSFFFRSGCVCVVTALMLVPLLKPALKWLPFGLPVSFPHMLSVDVCASAISGTGCFGHCASYKCPGLFLLNLRHMVLMGVSTAMRALPVHVLPQQMQNLPLFAPGSTSWQCCRSPVYSAPVGARLFGFLGVLSREQEYEDQLLASRAGSVYL